MENKHILMGICGSFCNHQHALDQLTILAKNNDVQVVVTDNVNTLSTRFFDRDVFIGEVERISGHPVMASIVEAEKVGPSNLYDIMCIIPMTATVCGKLANGIYDNPVTLAAKAMVRNQRHVVVGIASNDGLGITGANLMRLIAMKHYYAIPFSQDAPATKPYSIVSNWEYSEAALDEAMNDRQVQPILMAAAEGL